MIFLKSEVMFTMKKYEKIKKEIITGAARWTRANLNCTGLSDALSYAGSV